MAQTTYIARKGEDADFADLTADSLTINTATIEAGAVTLADSEKLTFGTGLDVTAQWDGTNLIVAANADDSLIEVGDSAATQKSFDLKIYGDTANGADYLYFDASGSQLYTTNVDLLVKDADSLLFGDGSDVGIQWDGTNLIVSAAADDSVIEIGDSAATQKSFDVKWYGNASNGADYFLFDASASALTVGGDARIDLSGAGVAAGNTDGGLIKAGTSGSRVVEDTADMKFLAFYLDNGATSGDNRGMYLRLYLTGAGGGGEALRVFTTVEDVAAGTAHGAHISLNFGSSGTVTGMGIAGRNTLHVPDASLGGGNVTYSALQAEIYNDGSSSDTNGNIVSYIRVVNDGDATGRGNVDDDAVLLNIQGVTAGAAKMFATGLTAGTVTGNCSASLKVLIGSTTYYIPLATAIS